MAGLAALVAVVLQFGLAPATLVFGILILIALMVVFLVFAQAVTLAKAKFTLPALVLTWTFLLLGVGTGVLLFSSVFFDLPLPLKTLILRSTSPSAGPLPERVSAVPTWQPLAGVIWNDAQETVAQVEVFVPEFHVTTFTDDQGTFALQLQATPQRQVRLIARKAGYANAGGRPHPREYRVELRAAEDPMMRRALVWMGLLCLLLPSVLVAQERWLRGKVVRLGEHDEKLPEVNLTVTIEETGNTDTTNSGGMFRITLPEIFQPGDKVTLHVDKPDWRIYLPVEGETRVPADCARS